MKMAGWFSYGEGPPIVPSRGWSALLTGVTAAAMAFLAILTLSAGLAAAHLSHVWQTDLANIATVSVSAPSDQLSARLDDTIEVLETTPGIETVRVMSAEEHAELLEPWLGANAALADLPAPTLIEVQLAGEGPDGPRLQARLDQSAEGARYDDHQAWRGPLAAAALALGNLASAATALVVLAAAAMIGLAAQATLAGNSETVRVIRLIGAEEGFIIRVFVTRIALRALIGGAIGAAAGLTALALMPEMSDAVGAGMRLTPSTNSGLALLISVPLGAMAVAVFASWLSIRAELKRIP